MVDQGSSRAKTELTLFGGPQLHVASDSVMISPFQGALLGLLAVHGNRGARRGSLLSYFWNTGVESRLRHRLSQLVYSLHQRLDGPRVIQLKADRYVLDPERVSSDLDTLQRAQNDRDLSRATSIVTRGFLSLLDPAPTWEVEQWIRLRTLQFRADVRALATEVWSEAKEQADWSRAEKAARALVQLDYRDEASLRKLLQAKALSGKVREAEAAYLNFQDVSLANNPDWTPEERTRLLLQQLDQISTRRSEFYMAPGRLPSTIPPLKGRRKAFQALTSLVQGTPEAGLRTVLVTGEGGIGKTRLVEESLATAPFNGIRVLVGRCSEFEKNIPLSPLLDALSEEWIEQRLETLPAPQREFLVPLISHFRPSPGGPWSGSEIEPGRVSRRLCEAIRYLLCKISLDAPLVIFLDDLHWADSTSLSVLEYVQRRWSDGNLTFVLSYRTGPDGLPISERRHFFSQIQKGDLHLIPLRELDRSASKELISWCMGFAPDEETLKKILSSSGGIPLFLIHVASTVRSAQKGVRPAKAPREPSIPLPIRPVLHDRISGLSPTSKRILEVLSGVNRELDSALGSCVTGLGQDDWARALEELESRMLLHWSRSGVRLRHDLIRTFIRERMSEARWREINRRLANCLSQKPRASPGELAVYYFHSGQTTHARSAARDAAADAERSGAYSEAAHYLRMALELPSDPDEKRVSAVAYATMLFRFRRLESARAALPGAYEELTRFGDIRQAMQLRLSLLECQARLGEVPPRVILAKVRDIKKTSSAQGWWESSATAMELGIRTILATDSPNSSGDLEQIMRDAQIILPRVNDVAGKIRLNQILSLYVFLGKPTRGLRAATEAASLAKAHQRGEPIHLSAGNRLLMCLIAVGDLGGTRGQKLCKELQELALRAGDPLLRCYPFMNHGVWQLKCGNPHGAIDTLESLLPHLDGVEAPEVEIRVRANLGLAYLKIDEVTKASEQLTIAEGLFSPLTPSPIGATLRAAQGLCCLRIGNYADARSIEESLSAPDVPWVGDPTVVLSFLSEMATLRNEGTNALSQVQRLRRRLRSEFPIHWLDITLLEGRLAIRYNLASPNEELRECKAWAKSKGLHEAAREADHLLRE